MTVDLAHDTITFERRLTHPPKAVFDAYADVDQRTIWSAPSPDEVVIFERHDFSEGGVDTFTCGLKESPHFVGTTRYEAIVDGETIVFTERLTSIDGALLAISLVTWSIAAEGDGAILTVVDQVTSVVGTGPIEGSIAGYGAMLDQLERYLARR